MWRDVCERTGWRRSVAVVAFRDAPLAHLLAALRICFPRAAMKAWRQRRRYVGGKGRYQREGGK